MPIDERIRALITARRREKATTFKLLLTDYGEIVRVDYSGMGEYMAHVLDAATRETVEMMISSGELEVLKPSPAIYPLFDFIQDGNVMRDVFTGCHVRGSAIELAAATGDR